MLFNFKYFSKFIFLLLSVVVWEGYSQSNFKHYSSVDGLPHDVTYNIIQDSKGYMWIGTDDGLSKFDGDDFKNYELKDGLTSNYVTDIEELPNNKFAIATWGGGLHFMENDSIYKLNEINDKNLKIYDIKYFNDKIYSYSGVSTVVFDLKNKVYSSKVFLKNSKSFSLLAKSTDSNIKLNPVVLNGNVYIHNKELAKHNFMGISKFSPDYKLSKAFLFLSKFNISATLDLGKKEFVFGAVNTLFFTNLIEVKNSFLVSNVRSNEHIHKILSVPENDDEFILIIQNQQREKRLISVNVATNKTFNIDKLLALKTTISDAIFDFEDNLWITTFGDGIYCYKYSSPNIKNILEGEYIIDLVKNKNTVYALASSKLFEFKNDSLYHIYDMKGFPKKLSIHQDKLSVSILNKKNDFISKFNLVDGRFFKETEYGIVRQSDTLFLDNKLLNISNEILVNSIEAKDNIIDFYTNKGKWVYKLDNLSFEKDTIFQKTLPSENIKDLIITNDKTYIASDVGLIIKKGDSIHVLNEKNGLQNERINCILINKEDIYLGTQQGISVIKSDKIYNFSKSFGIQSLAINKIIHSKSQLWLAGNNGISIVNIKDIKTSKPPILNISQTENKFVYDVVSYQDRKAITTQYKINNEAWVNLSENKGVLDFNNFAPNHYSIRFRTQNSYSPWLYSKAYTFSNKQLWYKLWWVILLFTLSCLSLVFFVFYKRLKTVSKRNAILKNEIDKRIIAEKELGEVRDNIARDFHDDLGNKLASISLMSDVLSNKVKNDASDVVKTIKSDADYLYKGTKDFIFSLQEKSNYLDEVRMYLSDFAEDYLYQFGIDFEVQSNIQKNIKLPYYWSKQIIYIFKEAITNAVKHSKASNAKMMFDFNDDKLEISFHDDGVGYDIDKVSTNGILNMKSRATKIGCELRMESSKGKGTQVLLKGKLPQ